MRAVRVKHLEKAVDVVLSVLRPFVAGFGEISNLRQPRAAVLGRRLRRSIRAFEKGDRVKESLKERSELGVCGRPIAPRMRLDPLTEMAERLRSA